MFSLFGVTVGLGTVAGQILGGVLLNVNLFGWGWRPIFLINVPIGIVAIVLARRLLPESKPDVADRLDPLGVVLLTTGVGAITAPLVLGQSEHWPLWTWVSFVAGAALVVSFLRWESRLGRQGGHPLLPLSLFEHRAFNVGLLVNLGFFSFFGSVLLTLTIFLQEGLKYSPMRAGLTFAPLGVAFALSSLRGRSLHARYGTAIISVGAATALARRRRSGPGHRRLGAVGHRSGALAGAGPHRDRQRARDPADRLRRAPERAGVGDGSRLGCAHHDAAVLHDPRYRRRRAPCSSPGKPVPASSPRCRRRCWSMSVWWPSPWR